MESIHRCLTPIATPRGLFFRCQIHKFATMLQDWRFSAISVIVTKMHHAHPTGGLMKN